MQESWGWNGGADNWTHRPLRPRDFANATGIDKSDASKALLLLMKQNILVRERRSNGDFYTFNEHPETWQERTLEKSVGKNPTRGEKTHGSWGKTPQRVGKNPTTTVRKTKRQAGSGDPKERSKEILKEKERDPLNFDMTSKEAEEVMQYSPEAREAACHLWNEMKKRGATAFPNKFFWRSVGIAAQMLQKASLDEIKRCITDLLDDPYITVNSMLKIQDNLPSWQTAQSKGGWRNKGTQIQIAAPRRPANDQAAFEELQRLSRLGVSH
jgi:hypothetical protein